MIKTTVTVDFDWLCVKIITSGATRGPVQSMTIFIKTSTIGRMLEKVYYIRTTVYYYKICTLNWHQELKIRMQ